MHTRPIFKHPVPTSSASQAVRKAPLLPRGRSLATALLAWSLASTALSNPVGGNVSGGSASIAANGNTLDIIQTTSKAIINWNGFDIGAGEATRFHQPDSASLTLNRVTMGGASQINGALSANGNIVIVNPHGIVFGSGSQVNVNSLVATSANITDANFMAGNVTFDQPGDPTAAIENHGTITAADAGLVGMVAPNVLNSGTINAKLGRVHLASGDTTTVDLYGDGLLQVAVSDVVTSQQVENTGSINAAGGTIALTAAAGSKMVNSFIHVGGELNAPAVGTKGGRIIIYAEGSHAVLGNNPAIKDKRTGTSTVLVSGTLDVSNDHGVGGKLVISADQVGILKGAVINANGAAGGGEVHIGGDLHGGVASIEAALDSVSATTPNALLTVIEQGAAIMASATDNGHGGTVSVWADDRTEFSGDITANGGINGGDGGFVETSGHKTLLALGTVNAISFRGRRGEWLLDPADITIGNTATSGNFTIAGGSYTANTNATPSYVLASTINTLLQAGTNVTISTGAVAGGGSGDITVTSAIIGTGGTAGASLTLSAYRNITISNTITLNNGALTLRADNTGIGSGAIQVNNAITTNGGAITMGGGSGAITAGSGYATGNGASVGGVSINAGANVNAGGGNIIVNGKGYVAAGSNITGVAVVGAGASLITSASGTINISGIGGTLAAGNYSHGVIVYNGGLVSAVNGSITMNGTAGGTGASICNYGIVADSNSTIQTTGVGNISLTATGGAGTGNNNEAIYVGGASVVSAVDGSITINGTGGGGGTSTFNFGVHVAGANSTVKTTGLGSLNITGIGGTGSGGNNNGVFSSVGNGFITTGSGNISLTGSLSSGGAAVYADAGNAYTTTGSGSITILADSIGIYNNAVNSIASLTVAPKTAGTSVGIGAGAGSLSITDTFIGRMTAASYIFGSISAGSLTINTAVDFGNKNVSFLTGTAGSDITLSGSYNSTGSGSLTLSAYRNIINNSTITLNNGALTLRADNTGISNGAIQVNNAITTNGGNITMGGGSGAITAGSGYAVGNAVLQNGVMVSANVNAGGGNIVVNGQSYNVGGVNVQGIYIAAQMITSGAGTISANGIATGNVAQSHGIVLGGLGSAIPILQTASGSINLTGSSTVTTTGGSYGIMFDGSINPLKVLSTSGAININGTGSTNATITGDQGIRMKTDVQILSTSGAITLTGGVPNAGAGDPIYANGTIIVNAGSGAINVYGDTWGSDMNAVTFTTTGALTVAPKTAATTMGIGTGAGTLSITDTYLPYLSGGNLVFGSTTTGALTINTTKNFADKNVTFISGGDINLAGNLTKATGSGTATYLFQANGNIYNTNSGGVQSTSGQLNITFDSDYDQLVTPGGYISLSGAATINTNGGNLVMGGGLNPTIGYALTIGGSIQPGIYIYGPTVSTGVGNITIHAENTTNVAYNTGFYSGGMVMSTTSGNISIYGINTGTGLEPYGIFLQNAGAQITTTSGAITLNGSSSGAVANAIGIRLRTNASVTSTGTGTVGAVTLIGSGSVGNLGVLTSGANVTTQDANIIVQSPSGGFDYSGGTFSTNGSNASKGNITFIADWLSASSAIAATGTISASPYSNIGMSIGTNVGGTLNINNAALNNLNGSNLIFGSSTTGAISINTANNFGTKRVTFISGSGTDITLAGTLNSSATGDAFTLASGRNFINSSATPFSLSGGGRWLVYSTSPSANTLGGLSGSFNRYSCTYSGGCAAGVSVPVSGNGFVYSTTPLLSITPTSQTITYGDAAPSLTNVSYGISGYLSSDAAADSVTGTLNGTTSYTQGSNAGNYGITYSGLASSLGYGFNFGGASLAVTKKNVTATANNQTITYGTSVPTTTVTYSGFYGADNAVSIGTAPTITSTQSGVVNAGTYAGNYTLSGGLATNYSLTYVAGNLLVNKRAATITSHAKTKTYLESLPALTGSNNLIAADASRVSFTYAPLNYTGAAGSYSIGATASDPQNRLTNYNLTTNYGMLNVFYSALPDTVAISSQLPLYNANPNNRGAHYHQPALTEAITSFKSFDAATSAFTAAGQYGPFLYTTPAFAIQYNLPFNPANITPEGFVPVL